VSNFAVLSWREQVTYKWNDDDDVIDKQSELDCYSVSLLKHQSANTHGASLGHI